jgi:hypothetical protein
MKSVLLYEEWSNFKGHENLPFHIINELNSMYRGIDGAWTKTGKPWLNSLSESIMASFSMNDFKNEVLPHLNESHDYNSIRKSYAIYELALLKTHRPDWFLNEEAILAIPDYNDHKVLLSKSGSMFIISMSTWSAITENMLSDFFDKAKEMAGDAWDSLADGAKKVAAFLAQITKSVADYTSKNPHEVAAITCNILAGIVSFFPVVGQVAAPLLTMIAGGIEVHAGHGKISHGIDFLKKVDDPIAKTFAAAKDGVPYILAGGVTMFLGSMDMLTAIKSATPGVGAIQSSVNTAAKKASKTMGDTLIGKAEHGLLHAVEGLMKKSSILKKANIHQLAHSATALLLILLVKGGKGILGKAFDGLVSGISAIGEAMDFLLNVPEKISKLIEDLSNKADSSATKIIANALKGVIKPITDGISKFIDKNIKPIVEPVTSYLKLLPENYKDALEQLDEHVKDVPDATIEIKRDKIPDYGDIKMNDEDKKALKGIETGESKKSSASGKEFEKDLKDADPNFKGIKGNPKKLTVEFEGWGDKKKDSWKKEMSIEELVKNMKSKDWSKIRFEYGGDYPTDLHKGGAYARLKAIKESAILPFNEWISR